jgi:hypothetical protein
MEMVMVGDILPGEERWNGYRLVRKIISNLVLHQSPGGGGGVAASRGCTNVYIVNLYNTVDGR